MTIIHRQFCPNLALANHTPHEVMRVSAIFAWEKWKKFVTLTWHMRVMGRFVSKGVCRGRNVGDFGITSTLFGGVWYRIKCFYYTFFDILVCLLSSFWLYIKFISIKYQLKADKITRTFLRGTFENSVEHFHVFVKYICKGNWSILS